jgi:hypothetical protein
MSSANFAPGGRTDSAIAVAAAGDVIAGSPSRPPAT